MAKTKELKKRYGAEEGEESSVLERAVSRERLVLSAIRTHDGKASSVEVRRFRSAAPRPKTLNRQRRE